MAKRIDSNIIARMLSDATQGKIPLDEAKRTLWPYLQYYVKSLNRKDVTLDSFNLKNNVNVAYLLSGYGKNYVTLNNNYHFTQDDIKKYKQSILRIYNYHNPNKEFTRTYNEYNRQAHKELKSFRMGEELKQTLAPYIDSISLQKVQRQYQSKAGIQFDPSDSPYQNDPEFPKYNKQYHDFKRRLGRTQQILDYLSKKRINFSIAHSTNAKHPDELVAVLPEHDNMQVTLMSDKYNHIGEVNAWENQYSFNTRGKVNRWKNGYSYNSQSKPEDFNAAALLDTVLNPTSHIVDVYNIPEKNAKNKLQVKNNKRVKYSDNSIEIRAIKDSKGKIHYLNMFVTRQDKHLQSMKDFTDKVKSNESISTPEMEAEMLDYLNSDNDQESENKDNGQDVNDIEDDDHFKINIQDKQEEIKNRFKDNWVPINAKRYPDEPQEYVNKRINDDRRNRGLYQTIRKQAKALGMRNVIVSRNSKGVYKYTYTSTVINPQTGQPERYDSFGIIGGYIQPNKNGAFKLEYNGKLKGWSVPGMRAYIGNDGDLRVKPFSSILREKVKNIMLNERNNPSMKYSVKAYSALDKLYTTDSYSTIIKHLGVNSPDYERDLIKTLRRRVRLPDTDLNNANAINENKDKRTENAKRYGKLDTKRKELLAHGNLRTIPKKWQRVVDREMTGIGHTMGATLYIGENVYIDGKTGKLYPGHFATKQVPVINKNTHQPVINKKTHKPLQKTVKTKFIPAPANELAKTALHKRPECQWDKYDPADRNIMWFNQATRNVPMDVVNVAYMTLSGYTENDAAVVTKKYAEQRKAYTNNPDKTHQRILLPGDKSRGLKIGDKITDAHGNKSTISYIIDPDKTDELHKLVSNDQKNLEDFNKTFKGYQLSEDQEKQKHDLMRKLRVDGLHYKMAAIVKANPDLDVIANPYSSISRLNAGSVREMQARGGIKHLNNATYFDRQGNAYHIPLNGITMGKEMYAVCEGQRVDEKTAVYTDDMYKHGKGRKFDQQVALAAAAANIPKTLKFVYKNNPNHGWNKLIDDFHLMGFDMDKNLIVGAFHYDYYRKQPTTGIIKMPNQHKINEILSADKKTRENKQFGYDDFAKKYKDAKEKAEQTHSPILMELPVKYRTHSGIKTNMIAVPYNKIDAQDELHKREGREGTENSWLNLVHNIYKYAAGISQTQPHKQDLEMVKQLAKQLSNRVIAEDLGHKNNIIKSQIFSRAMPGSSTSVVTPDPTLKINELEVGEKTWKNMIKADPKLKTDPNEVIMGWRSPVLRDGGIRAFHVKPNKAYTGVGINPVDDKSMDMDHDGDTMGLVPIPDKDAQEELRKKLLPSDNLIDKYSHSQSSYLETGLELTGSYSRQGRMDAEEKALKLQKQQGWSNEQTRQAAEEFYWKDPNNPRHIIKTLNSPEMKNTDKETRDAAQNIIDDGFLDNKNASLGIGLDCSTGQTYLNGVQKLVASGAKGHYNDDFENDDELRKAKEKAHVTDDRPLYDNNGIMHSKNFKKLIHYYKGEKNDLDYHDSMVASAVKADLVGPAGAIQQKFMWFLRDKDPADTMNITSRPTNGVLRAKHSAEKAREREKQVLGALSTLAQGKDPDKSYGKYNNSTITPFKFENKLIESLNDKLNTDVSIDSIKRLGHILTSKNTDKYGRHMIMQHDEREQIAPPIDEMAYGSGSSVSVLNNARGIKKINGQYQQIKPRPFATGQFTKLFSCPKELLTNQLLAPQYELSDEQKKQLEAQQQQKLQAQALENQKMQQPPQPKPNQQTLDDSEDDLLM